MKRSSLKAKKTEPRPSFNLDHPERQPDEVFITNADDDHEFLEGREKTSWEKIDYKTKRRGMVAYNIHGERFNGAFPVFVKQEEIKKALGVKTLKEMLPKKAA